jgi:hypothetical protein
MVLKMNRVVSPILIAVVCSVLAIVFAGYVDFARLRDDELSDKRDIYALWQDGQRLLRHENPYARILSDQSGINRKYATYLPVFYILSAGSQKIVTNYPQFITFWRAVSFVFYVAIGVALALPFFRPGWMVWSVFVLLLWLFNRWTLKSVELVNIDFLAILPLLASLLLIDRHRRVSLLLFGLSLAIKQVGIFLVPLYLVWAWNESDGRARLRQTLIAAMWIAIIPVLVSLPFFIWGPTAFVKSILFSVVRNDDSRIPAESLDDLLDWPRLYGKAIMLGMMALVYATAYQNRLGRWTAALMVLTVFVTFNAIWFTQYEVWPIALLPLVVLDVDAGIQERSTSEAIKRVGRQKTTPAGASPPAEYARTP